MYSGASSRQPPSLPSVTRLELVLYGNDEKTPLEHRFLEELRFEVVFPAIQKLFINLSFGRCSSCEWLPGLPPQNADQAEQYVRHLVAPFFAPSSGNRQQLSEVVANADDRYKLDPLIDFTVLTSEKGPLEQAMVFTRQKRGEGGKQTPLL